MPAFYIGINKNPIVQSLLFAQFSQQGDTPIPPTSKYMVTEVTGYQMVTESGSKMITE